MGIFRCRDMASRMINKWVYAYDVLEGGGR